MNWEIYEYVDDRNCGAVETWIRRDRLQAQAVALFDQKLTLLASAGPDLPPGLLARLGGGILKLKVRAMGVQLRPFLCEGPIKNSGEFTILIGAVERDGKLQPRDARSRAEDIRRTIVANPSRRRRYDGS